MFYSNCMRAVYADGVCGFCVSSSAPLTVSTHGRTIKLCVRLGMHCGGVVRQRSNAHAAGQGHTQTPTGQGGGGVVRGTVHALCTNTHNADNLLTNICMAAVCGGLGFSSRADAHNEALAHAQSDASRPASTKGSISLGRMYRLKSQHVRFSHSRAACSGSGDAGQHAQWRARTSDGRTEMIVLRRTCDGGDGTTSARSISACYHGRRVCMFRNARWKARAAGDC